jgi:hypothetical protein
LTERVEPSRLKLTEVVWRSAVMLGGFIVCSIAALLPLGGESLTNVFYEAAFSYGGGGLRIIVSRPGESDTVLAVAALLGLVLSRPLVAYHALALTTDLAPRGRLVLARIASLAYVAGAGFAFAVSPLLVEAAIGTRMVSLVADVDIVAKSMAVSGLIVEVVAVAHFVKSDLVRIAPLTSKADRGRLSPV